MQTSSIDWTELSWNPVTGCTKCSPGCLNCYAERMAHRLHAMGNPRYANGFKVTCHPEALDEPLRRRIPSRIFVCSMSDLFHPDIPERFVDQVFRRIAFAERHTFIVLTKRASRMCEYACRRLQSTVDNLWLGVSVCTQREADAKLPILQNTPAAVRIVSAEPQLEPIDWAGKLDGIGWAIVGCESGPGARDFDEDWARDLREECLRTDTALFYKQAPLPPYAAYAGCRVEHTPELDGRRWVEIPEGPNDARADSAL